MANILQWTGTTKYTDGSDFSAADYAGYERKPAAPTNLRVV
jgi:hypothetical protein